MQGTVQTSGAKNAALPAMAAALLTEEPVVLENIPQVRDIETERKLLAAMGAEVELGYGRAHHRTTLCCRNLAAPEASYELVKTMRASTLVLGPLVARTGRARVSMPGGCAIGARPIDLHIKGLEKLGATITQEHGYVEARCQRLKGAEIVFDKITVTGTEDIMMAATLAEGETILENCAREPEVVDLAELLIKMGARIEGAGTHQIRIHGVEKLHGARHRIIPDRIEAGTFIVAAALTQGEIKVANCNPRHLTALIQKLRETGVDLRVEDDAVVVTGGKPLQGADITTEEYPGFPTDMQAQYMALATQVDGVSVVTENIFENRFMHVQELVRMGANIKIDGRRAVVRGKAPLSAAAVQASDLRASASLVIAALIADGETIIDRVYHIDRGYERIEEKLRGLGAKIRRIGEMFPKKATVPASAL
ncbi:MAG TPA: UDP-N-acetylglucosamine 1-carboxyvinyltransferase [Terriglobales bacterium]|nr:UDP-N-acetylglucosamine 1-carboxyvinyltransferase [Terriglobales bacterium]